MAFPARPRAARRQKRRGTPRACWTGDPAITEPRRPVARGMVQERLAAGAGVLRCGDAAFSDPTGADVVATATRSPDVSYSAQPSEATGDGDSCRPVEFR